VPAPISCNKHLSSLFAGTSGNLGLTIKLEESEKRELLASPYYSIFAAQSPHRQTISYPVARHEVRRGRLLSMTSDRKEVDSVTLQLVVNQELEKLSPGSYLFRFSENGELINVGEVFSDESLWTLAYSQTSTLENTVRAAHDLPLGSSESLVENWQTIIYQAPAHLDMQKPYLHLFAHNPKYKLFRFTSHHGVIMVSGAGGLYEEITHAGDYLEGVVNE
jgi:hypothetical protein